MPKKPCSNPALHLAADEERFTNARTPARRIDQLIDGVATTLFVIRAARKPPTSADIDHAKDLIGKVDILVELAKLESGVTQLDIRAVTFAPSDHWPASAKGKSLCIVPCATEGPMSLKLDPMSRATRYLN